MTRSRPAVDRANRSTAAASAWQSLHQLAQNTIAAGCPRSCATVTACPLNTARGSGGAAVLAPPAPVRRPAARPASASVATTIRSATRWVTSLRAISGTCVQASGSSGKVRPEMAAPGRRLATSSVAARQPALLATNSCAVGAGVLASRPQDLATSRVSTRTFPDAPTTARAPTPVRRGFRSRSRM